MRNDGPIPCHLISGPLGVGKTTAIIDYLKRNSANQFVAVLVNDFGPVGLDGAIIESDTSSPAAGPQAKIMMVPGGCICCSAAAGVVEAFQELGRLPRRIDRVIIEPSGVALVGDMVDLLRGFSREFNLELRPVVTLMEPKMLNRPAFTRVQYFIRMIEAADVLVANRCDLAAPEDVERFKKWAAELYPPKLRIITTDHGQLPDEVFELRADPRQFSAAESFGFTLEEEERLELVRTPTATASHHHHDGMNHRADGLVWDAAVQFRSSAVESALRKLAAEGLAGQPIARLKGILHTEGGWQLVEIACGAFHSRNTDYRRDNRIDWISEGQPIERGAIMKLLVPAIIGCYS